MAATVVYTNINATDDKLPTAEVALFDANTWMICGSDWRMYSTHTFRPMPQVACPVVDLSLCPDEKAIQYAISNYLCDLSRDSLISRLIAAGAAVTFSLATV